jgi:hypothetical protein
MGFTASECLKSKVFFGTHVGGVKKGLKTTRALKVMMKTFNQEPLNTLIQYQIFFFSSSFGSSLKITKLSWYQIFVIIFEKGMIQFQDHTTFMVSNFLLCLCGRKYSS